MRLFMIVLLSLPMMLLAEVQLPSYISDHMVIQQGTPFPLSGKGATPSLPLEVIYASKTYQTQVNSDGSWQLTLEAQPAGGPHIIQIKQGEHQYTINDVLVGEVWLGGGQSNMEWAFGGSDVVEEALAKADLNQLRFFRVEHDTSPEPKDDLIGEWIICTPETAPSFSAIGFLFSDQLIRDKQVPVGFIQSAYGGTFIEPWIPFYALQNLSFMNGRVQAQTSNLENLYSNAQALEEDRQQWRQIQYAPDPGNRGKFMGFHRADFDDSKWETILLPDTFENSNLIMDGAVWFRKTVTLPDGWTPPATLSLSTIDDFDITYVNGEEIGRTDQATPRYWVHKRVYPNIDTIDNKLSIAIRVYDHYGMGGFTGISADMMLEDSKGNRIPLAGEWRYHVSIKLPDIMNDPSARPPPSDDDKANLAYLYNAMIAPLTHYPIRGFLWYQGENNAHKPEHYDQLFTALINSWRTQWREHAGVGDEEALPFLFCQLANFQALQRDPHEGGWAPIRAEQEAALALPNTAMASLIDCGEADDVHPRDKQTPAKRLYNAALAVAYGQDVSYRHPAFSEWKTWKGDTLLLSIDNTEGKLTTSDGEPPRGFAVRDDSDTWHWATAVIIGNKIMLTPPIEVTPEAITAVCYSWANNPIGNVVNANGLPLLPFDTSYEALSQ